MFQFYLHWEIFYCFITTGSCVSDHGLYVCLFSSKIYWCRVSLSSAKWWTELYCIALWRLNVCIKDCTSLGSNYFKLLLITNGSVACWSSTLRQFMSFVSFLFMFMIDVIPSFKHILFVFMKMFLIIIFFANFSESVYSIPVYFKLIV